LNAKSTVLIQNGGTDKVSIGSTTVILSAALQASESGGLQFGGSGQNVVSIVNSTTGISLTAAADTKLVTESEIAS